MSEYYDPDKDARPQSPLLQAFRPKATPSPSPPPFVVPEVPIRPNTQTASSPSSRRRLKPNRRRTRPSQGDFVLIRVMDPNQPEIARQAGARALYSDSGSEASDSDMDMEEPSQTAEPAPLVLAQHQKTQDNASVVDLQATAQKALDTNPRANGTSKMKYPPPFPRDSVVEIDSQPRITVDVDTPASQASSVTLLDGEHVGVKGVDLKSSIVRPPRAETPSSELTRERQGSLANGYSHEDSLATSPNLAQLTIPPSRGSPSQKLPAFQPPHSPSRDGPVGSPKQERTLPSFRHLSELAETAINEQQEAHRANGFPHRPSIASSTQSPTSGTRQLSISSPFTVASPNSVNGESASRDLFLSRGQSHLTLFSTRRPSQASDAGPYSTTLHSATTNESYQSSDGLSPGTQPTPIEGHGHRMSIDGALTTRTLPLPNGPLIQHIPPHGSGGFKCDYGGCTAAPFQTQYLLK
jgi:hypothetical protein